MTAATFMTVLPCKDDKNDKSNVLQFWKAVNRHRVWNVACRKLTIATLRLGTNLNARSTFYFLPSTFKLYFSAASLNPGRAFSIFALSTQYAILK